MNGSSPRPMCAAEPPRLFSRWPKATSVPSAPPFCSTSFAANGGGCSSGIGSATDSAGTASAIATGELSIVASSKVSAGSSAATSIEGGRGAAGAAFLANGVPHSKQNLAAGGFSAPHFGQAFPAGRAAASTDSGGGTRGGAGGGLRAGPAPEAAAEGMPSPMRARPRDLAQRLGQRHRIRGGLLLAQRRPAPLALGGDVFVLLAARRTDEHWVREHTSGPAHGSIRGQQRPNPVVAQRVEAR